MATGFHGFHVIIGTIFLIVCLVRAIAGQFTPDPPFRLRGGGLVLALRRRGVAVPVRLHLCLGRLGRNRLSAAEPPVAKAALLGLCPRCGQGPLFDGYLNVAPRVPGLRPGLRDVRCRRRAGGVRHPDRRRHRLRAWRCVVEFTFQPPYWVHAVLVAAADRHSDLRLPAARPNRRCWCCNTSTRRAKGGWLADDAALPPLSRPHHRLRGDLFAILIGLGVWQLAAPAMEAGADRAR